MVVGCGGWIVNGGRVDESFLPTIAPKLSTEPIHAISSGVAVSRSGDSDVSLDLSLMLMGDVHPML